MARRRLSVKEQIERTLPDELENAWFKKPRKKLSNAAIERNILSVKPRTPRKGETLFIHTHTKGGLTPTPKDIMSFIRQIQYGIKTSVIANTKNSILQGYTVIKPKRNADLKKMYKFMQKLLAEDKPNNMEEGKRQVRRVRAALTRYRFKVRIVQMPGSFAQTKWKKTWDNRRIKTTKKKTYPEKP